GSRSDSEWERLLRRIAVCVKQIDSPKTVPEDFRTVFLFVGVRKGTQERKDMNQSLNQLLNIKYPLIQAPMAGVSTPALAAAVSEAGGLGSLGLASASLDQARGMIGEVQRLTRKPVNINFFC